MKKILIFALILLFSVNTFAQSLKNEPGTFTLGNQTYLLNGKPFVIRAGEIHFPRIPREYWEHRIKMCKAMGMNTICIYLFWNLHEEKPDVFDFSGQKDVAEFVRLIQKNGMYCMVRPGPYACAEWDMGGLPWWLLKKKDLQVRTKEDAYFMERARKYLKEVGKQLAPLQIQNGGNIIMVQVENEYAVYGKDAEYMGQIRNAIRDAGFDKVQLFRCDWSSNFNKYRMDDLATGLNFGAGSNIDNQFKTFKEIYPESPLMCSEYWSGWFDHWGRPHETRSIQSFIGSMKDMMDRKISFSLYMAHGGTSFGQWGGANAPAYSCMVTSYDYNAPINESGNTTDKFFAVRDLLNNYLQEGEKMGEIPAANPIIEIPTFRLTESANLFENLPKPKKSVQIQSMEMFDQGWGRILYRANIPASKEAGKLVITEVHDWAIVFINGKLIGKLDRRRGENTLKLPPMPKNSRLDIMVEATGRVNYGKAILDRKGITGKVEIIGRDTTEIKNWLVYNFPVDYTFQKNAAFKKAKANGPAWYRTTFNLDKPGDTFLDLSTWGKGMVWVNGYNLGRFWKIGPQQTLYMPGCWLKKGSNEIIVLDLDGPESNTITGLSKPILDKIRLDESLLNRKKGQNLDLANETPIKTGSFSEGTGWKEVKLDQLVEARYFCLEALSAQKENDPFTSVAELEVTGVDNTILSRLKWKVIYADSEEVNASNNSAERVYDQQESTIWQTQWTAGKPKQPHQIVIDMGEKVKISGLRYLPRSDNNSAGMIKEYRFYAKTEAFKF